MSNEAHESEVITRLAAIEAQLQQFNQLVSSLDERVARSQGNFMLVADVYKYKKLQDLLAAGDLQEAD